MAVGDPVVTAPRMVGSSAAPSDDMLASARTTDTIADDDPSIPGSAASVRPVRPSKMTREGVVSGDR